MILKPGDIFCTQNPMWLGRTINAWQKIISSDNRSDYSHAGIILGPSGSTFEALWRNKSQNLYKAYQGKKILIGRHNEMTNALFLKGWKSVEKHKGKLYAGHRLFLFFIPPLAKYLSTGGFAVCSELACKFLYNAGLVDYWKGKNPDNVADMIHRWRSWTVIYEGVCPPE